MSWGWAASPKTRSPRRCPKPKTTLSSTHGLVLLTIGAMEQHSFCGGARIGTGAFELILKRFETSKLSDLR
jgi:hypothetical protein